MYRFRPRVGPTIAAALGVLFLGNLCAWQIRRMGESRVERERYAERLAEPSFDMAAPPPDPDLHRASMRGVPDWDHYVLLAGKYMWGQMGYEVVVPVVGDTASALVDVGWVPFDEVDLVLAKERAVPGVRTYDGLARHYDEDPDAKGTAASGCRGAEGFPPEADGFQRKWRTMSPHAMAQGRDVPSLVLYDGEGIAEDADIPDRVPPIGGWRTAPQQRPNGEYALTWGGLALSLFLVWGSASFVRLPPEESGPGPSRA